MLNKSYASAAILAFLIPVSTFAADYERVEATDTLPDAKPGECYSKVIVPAVFEAVTEEVMVRPETSTVEIIPATYDVQEKEVGHAEKFCYRGAAIFTSFGVGGSSSTVRLFGEVQDKVQVWVHLGDDEVVAVEQFG